MEARLGKMEKKLDTLLERSREKQFVGDLNVDDDSFNHLSCPEELDIFEESLKDKEFKEKTVSFKWNMIYLNQFKIFLFSVSKTKACNCLFV